ncbi:hypothetical protein Tco_0967296 [Tanacetum coccineum]
MFVPCDSTVLKLQTAEDLQGDALLHYDAEMELMNLILLSISNEIYNSVDACTTAKEMWKRFERLMRGAIQNQVDRETRFTNKFDQFVAEPREALISFLNSLQPEWLKYVTQVRLAKRLTVDSFDDIFDYLQQFEKLVNASREKKLEKSHDPLALVAHTDPLTSAILLLARAIAQNFSTPINNHLRTSSNTRNQAIIQGDMVNIQSRNSSNTGRNTRRAYIQEEVIKGSNVQNETGNELSKAKSLGFKSILDKGCWQYGEAWRFNQLIILLMAGPSYDSAFINEVQSSSIKDNQEQMYPTNTKIINSTISDDQIDSNIIFDEPNGNANSGSVENDTHVANRYTLEQLARNAYQEAEKQ